MSLLLCVLICCFLSLDVELLNAVANNSPHVIKFLTVMALCNTVVPIKRFYLCPCGSDAPQLILIHFTLFLPIF